MFEITITPATTLTIIRYIMIDLKNNKKILGATYVILYYLKSVIIIYKILQWRLNFVAQYQEIY
jgi:hypothetical protein